MNSSTGGSTYVPAAPAGTTAQLHRVYERALDGASVRRRFVDVDTVGSIHVLEKGDGRPAVFLHGTTATAAMFLPVLEELDGVHAVAVDRPGHGLSDAIDLPRHRFRDAATAWLDRVLDALALDATALVGHSGGAVWALWFALAHPERVTRLVLIGPPALPGTRCPLPIRVAATPGLGELVARLVPPSPKSVLQFARFMGERDTIVHHPNLIDLFVAAGRDPVADRTSRAEIRALASPFALLSPSGFRRRQRVRPAELRQLAVPTLLVWGEHEPLGSISVAQNVAGQIPGARLDVLPGGHAPWLGHPRQTAATIADFVR